MRASKLGGDARRCRASGGALSPERRLYAVDKCALANRNGSRNVSSSRKLESTGDLLLQERGPGSEPMRWIGIYCMHRGEEKRVCREKRGRMTRKRGNITRKREDDEEERG